ncbi:dihydrofolate reductase family protein [Devosia sp. 2618]|uniref:dihydrofolate reductase family protein n=1 Tax=Devosia sp. 2618 TaxID=3156454 RepID=UPI003397442D
MKPHVIMHMASSIDGTIVPKDWPIAALDGLNDAYEDIHRALKGDAWLVGRVTMAEFAEGAPRPMTTSERFPRKTWKAPGAASGPYAIAVDREGKLHLNISHANGDPLIVILTEGVSDDHLAELRRDGISYIFAGATELDLALALDILADEFAIMLLLLEGGGGINGSFLDADLIDEISLMLSPVADGNPGPSTFDNRITPAKALKLQSVTQLDGGVLHIRYAVIRAE